MVQSAFKFSETRELSIHSTWHIHKHISASLRYLYAITAPLNPCADQTQPGPCLSVKIALCEAGCPPFILSQGCALRGRCVKKIHSGPGSGGHRCCTRTAGENRGSPCGW